jgi:hypothetical protein
MGAKHEHLLKNIAVARPCWDRGLLLAIASEVIFVVSKHPLFLGR